MDYRQMFHDLISDKHSRILEIGPLNRPLVDKSIYPNAIYCDIRTTEQIKELYSGSDYLETTTITVPIDEIVDVDVVLNTSYHETFNNQPPFDYVVASHVLEHVEDLIDVLQDISTILATNGQFIIYYPDTRFCFDHFRAEASFRDAYDVYKNKRPALARMVLDFFHSAIPESRPYKFWSSENLHELLPVNDTTQALEKYMKSCNGEFMDDVHYWPFSDKGFVKFLFDLTRADMLNLTCMQVHPTLHNTQEFLLILQKNLTWNRDDALQKLRVHYSSIHRFAEIIKLNQFQKEITNNYQENISELKEKLNFYQGNNAELQQQFNTQLGHNAELQKLFNLRLDYIIELQQQLNTQQNNNADLAKLFNSRLDYITELQQQLSTQQSNYAELQQQLDIQQDNNADLENLFNLRLGYITELQEQLKIVQDDNAELNQQLGIQQSGNADLQQQLSITQNDNTELQQQLNIQQNYSAELQQQLDIQQNHSAELQQQLNIQQNHSAELQLQLDIQQNNNIECQQQLNITQNDKIELQQEISILTDEIETCKKSISWKITSPLRVFGQSSTKK